ncbi:carbohydrate ABC transporter permease, partial [Streptomyces sp. SID6137]|nr:carbohydrate ABC transporter permease [Streptomyces sp. SID6137]
MSVAEKAPETGRRPARARAPRFTDEHGRRVRVWELVLRYVLLIAVLALTVGPFVWQLSTSFKGPTEDIFSSPP